MDIKFQVNKRGQRIAYWWMRAGSWARWVRINLEEAEFLIATGQAVEYKTK